jgi:Ca-activated chloride channel family protein
MLNGWGRGVWAVCALLIVVDVVAGAAQDAPLATFRSSVSYVSLTAVVRDRHGRSVRSLSRNDFQVLDSGEPRPIVDLRSEESAPASVALLIDGSGSMRLGGADVASTHIADAILNSLQPGRDEAALFTFDRRLITLQEFTRDLRAVRRGLGDVQSWGSTSLFDAIGGTAGIVAKKTQNRRAVVVLTDGGDNASAYTPDEIAAIASSIDVPVYIFALGTDPFSEVPSPMEHLAQLTGGAYYAVRGEAAIAAGISSLVEELRHQYVLAFESAPERGWRGVQVVMRDRGLRVRTRRYYVAGTGE